jgi:Fe-S cluster biogenesis protein NfuA
MSKRANSNNTDSDLRQRILAVLDLIRPAIQSDGGDIELVSIGDDGVVQIRFLEACQGCPSSSMTLKFGIEENLKKNVPEVTAVIEAP